MEKKDEGQPEGIFHGFGKKVDQFKTELNEAGEKLQKEFDEKFEELKQSAEKIKREAEDKEKWKEVEGNLKKAAGELSGAFKAAFRKRKP